MEKAESLSFPTVIGSGGRGQSLHGEILVGAKRVEVVILWVPNKTQPLFKIFSEQNNSYIIFYIPEKLYLNVTSCDLLEFLS